MTDARPPRRRRRRRAGGTLKDGERRQLALASRKARRPEAPEEAPHDRVLCDGGSRGNPGPAAIAAVLLTPDDGVVQRRAARIGTATAAEAEYRAILLGLELAARHGVDALEVCSDSQLAIAGIEGPGPADATLAGLAREVRTRAGGFSAVTWTWHPRAQNDLADGLVRELLW